VCYVLVVLIVTELELAIELTRDRRDRAGVIGRKGWPCVIAARFVDQRENVVGTHRSILSTD
jgi:hypothetical protein